MVLSLDDLKKLSKPATTEDVEIPGVGTFRLKQMTARERMSLGVTLMEQEGSTSAGDVFANLWFDVLCHTVVDASGVRIFATNEGREVLEGLDPALLAPIGRKALEMHGFTEAARNAAIEAAKKNLSDAPSGVSPSTSPENLEPTTPTIS